MHSLSCIVCGIDRAPPPSPHNQLDTVNHHHYEEFANSENLITALLATHSNNAIISIVMSLSPKLIRGTCVISGPTGGVQLLVGVLIMAHQSL